MKTGCSLSGTNAAQTVTPLAFLTRQLLRLRLSIRSEVIVGVEDFFFVS